VQAQVSYGPLRLSAANGQTQHGVLVTFPTNLATVDPSLYQENYGSQSRSCAFSSSVTQWDTLLYVGDWYSATPSDTFGSVFGSVTYDSNSMTYNSATWNVYSEIYTGISYGSGPDTITSTGGSVSTTDSGQVFCYELKYTDFQNDHSAVGTYGYTSGTGTGPITTATMTPASNDFVLSYMDYGLACGQGSAYATGGWSGSSATAWLYHDGTANECGTGKDYYVVSAAVYANAWSSGSTSASMSACGPSSSGACVAVETQASFPIQGIVPFNATLDSIGSPQTITISGDGRAIPTFVGNGLQSDNIRATAGGVVTLTLPTGYVWDRTGNGTLGVQICSPGGTCSSASATYKPILDYVYTVQLTNSQGSATPTTFQQAVQIPVSTLGISSYLASDIGNVVFCADSACATPLYAWIQNCQVSTCPTSSTYVNTWVKLTSAISANSYTDIYMALLPTTTDFNSYWGEAPQLSSTYGANDNGASVFTFYANFAGTSFNEGVWGHSSSGTTTITVNNGLGLTAHENGAALAIVTHSSYSGIFDAYVADSSVFLNSGDTFKVDMGPVLTTASNGTSWELGNGYTTELYTQKSSLGVVSGDIDLIKDPADSLLALHSTGSSKPSQDLYGTAWPSTGLQYAYTGSPPGQLLSATDNTYTQASAHFGIQVQGTGGTSTQYDSATLFYTRVRAYPPNEVMPSVQIGVTQPIKATLVGSGSNENVSVSGCNPNPTLIIGDGNSHTIFANPSCILGLSLPSSSGYVWEDTGTISLNVTTCGSDPCGTSTPSYMKATEATMNVGNGTEPFQSFVNITSSTSRVLVTLNGGGHNNLNGASCVKAPCTPPSGDFGFQFNIVFPHYLVQNVSNSDVYVGRYGTSCAGKLMCGPFMVQATIEFHGNGTCKAKPQGAPGYPPAPKVLPQDSFACNHITTPGANFAWVVDSTGANGSLVDIKFQINGITNGTWSALGAAGMFTMPGNASSVWMNDTYAQSSFTGPSSSASYGNMYSAGGFVSYTGVENLADHMHCPIGCSYIFTSEYSNLEYTPIPAHVTSFNQTYDGGVFANYYEGSSGSVTGQGYSIGPPSGQYAHLQALTSGSTACLEDAFGIGGPPVNGTVAIYGNSGSGYTSSVQVAVSTSSASSCASGTGWTTVYTGSWAGVSAAKWIALNSTHGVEYVKITASYSSGAANIYVGAISIFMGSYGETQTNSMSGSGSVTTAGYALGVNDSHYAILQANSNGSKASIEVGLGTEYSGPLLLDGYLSSGPSSSVAIQISSTGLSGSWTNPPKGCQSWGGSSPGGWIECFGVSQVLYVLITVTWVGGATDLYLNSVYVA